MSSSDTGMVEIPEDVRDAAKEACRPITVASLHDGSVSVEDVVARAIMADRERWGTHGFMDKVDFECELGGAMGGNTVYPSEEDCASANAGCIDQCGMVEVSVRLVRIVRPEDFSEVMAERVQEAVQSALSHKEGEGR